VLPGWRLSMAPASGCAGKRTLGLDDCAIHRRLRSRSCWHLDAQQPKMFRRLCLAPWIAAAATAYEWVIVFSRVD